MKRLLITVNNNDHIGTCSIADHFREKWHTGLKQIDEIPTIINDYADDDSITVTDNGKEVYKLQGQQALLLGHLSDFLVEYLNIKVKK